MSLNVVPADPPRRKWSHPLLSAVAVIKRSAGVAALGLFAPTSDSVEVVDIDSLAPSPEVRKRIGYLDEHESLPDMSAGKFVTHVGRVSAVPS